MNLKPLRAYAALLDTLLPLAEHVPPSAQRLPLPDTSTGEPTILLLSDGYATTWRHPDALRMLTLEAPFIFGMSVLASLKIHYTLEAAPDAGLYRLSFDRMMAAVEEHEMGRAWSLVAAYEMRLMHERNSDCLLQDSKALVHRQVQRYASLPPTVRDTLPLMRYLMQVTVLSKSTLQRALTAMKTASAQGHSGQAPAQPMAPAGHHHDKGC